MADEDVANAASGVAPALGWAGFAFSALSMVYGFMETEKARRRERDRMQRMERRLRFVSSPENFANVLAYMRPIFRENMAQPIKAAATSAAATRAGRAGTTGSGIAEAQKSAAASAGEFAASNAAAAATGDTIMNQLQSEIALGGMQAGSAMFGLGGAQQGAAFLGQLGQGLAGASALVGGDKPVTGDPGRNMLGQPLHLQEGAPFIQPVQNTAPAQLPGAFAQPFADPRFPPPRR